MVSLSAFSRLQPLPRYITVRCVQLSCLMLCCALVTLVWAGAWGLENSLRHEYAALTGLSACTVFFAGLFGGIFLEDILRKT